MHKLIPDNLSNAVLTDLVLIGSGYIIMFFIIKQMSLCKKWARMALVIICVIVAGSYMLMFKNELRTSMIEGALFALQIIFEIIAFIFLYNKECNTWFNSRTTEMLS